jgi:hypothetical protein
LVIAVHEDREARLEHHPEVLVRRREAHLHDAQVVSQADALLELHAREGVDEYVPSAVPQVELLPVVITHDGFDLCGCLGGPD